MPVVIPGVRGWNFTSLARPAIAISEVNTDFKLDPVASGNPAQLGFDITESWAFYDPSASASLARRIEMEDRIQVLRENVGLVGTLTVTTEGYATKTFYEVRLRDVEILQNGANKLLEYTLHFEYRLPGVIGRNFKLYAADGTTLLVNWDVPTFVVSQTREDRAQFKDVFRNAMVRIPSGVGLRTVTVTTVERLLYTADSPIPTRQSQEDLNRALIDHVGLEVYPYIDNENYGKMHFTGCQPVNFLPETVSFDFTFIGDYAYGDPDGFATGSIPDS